MDRSPAHSAPHRTGGMRISQLLSDPPSHMAIDPTPDNRSSSGDTLGNVPPHTEFMRAQVSASTSYDGPQGSLYSFYPQPSVSSSHGQPSQKRHFDGSIVEPTGIYTRGLVRKSLDSPPNGPSSSASSVQTVTAYAPPTSMTDSTMATPFGHSPQNSVTNSSLPSRQLSGSAPKIPATSTQASYPSQNYIPGASGVVITGSAGPMGPPTKRVSKAPKAPMRSSIACLSCRKSKIKCENQGPSSACDTCIKASRRCQYPSNDSSLGIGKRPESISAPRSEREGGERDKKRIKRYGEFLNPNAAQSRDMAKEALSFEFLTMELWDKVFDLYKLHFSSELLFIHIPTLRENVERKLTGPDDLTHLENIPLLGVLTLTARFHVDLSKYISYLLANPKSRSHKVSNNLADAASGYYAKILNTALGPMPGAFTKHGVERVQALLILGVHEWMRGKDSKAASVYITAAINLARSMKLGMEEADIEAHRRGPRVGPMVTQGQQITTSPASTEANIRSEIRRRTMYSCFILDRFINLGEDVSWLMPVTTISLQLPIMDRSMDRGEVNTLVWARKSAVGNPDPVVFDNDTSYFVRLIEIWGEIAKYSADGGRAKDETNPPWQESRFQRLNLALQKFIDCLPHAFTLSESNFRRYDSDGRTLYISVHMIISLCNIMLHREYVPFVALRCSKPVGPLDPPLIDNAPEGYWVSSADTLFRAARDIASLVEWAGDRLPTSPITLFGVWTSAFVGLYAWHFPHMDVNDHMCHVSESTLEDRPPASRSGATAIVFGALTKMAGFMAVGGVWVRTFQYCDDMYRDFADRFAEHQSERAESGEASTPINADNPGGKHLWDNKYSGVITGDATIMTHQSPTNQHRAFRGNADASAADTSAPASPSENEVPTPPHENDSFDPTISEDDYMGSDMEDEAAEMLDNLTFMEVVPWMRQKTSEDVKLDADQLIRWGEKIQWGHLTDQNLPTDDDGDGRSDEGTSSLS